MPLIRSLMTLSDFVDAPRVESVRGPVCMTCGRLVDSEELVEGHPSTPGGWVVEQERRPDGTFGHLRRVYVHPQEGSTTVKVLVKHHGAEELGTFDMGSTNWDERDLASMMRRRNWFDPTRHEGLGLGKRIDNPGDWDEGDAPKIITSGSGH